MNYIPLLILLSLLLSNAYSHNHEHDELTYTADGEEEYVSNEEMPEYPPGFNIADLDEIQPYQLYMINHPDSKCLDGTQSAFYYYPGNTTEPVNPELIVYFYSGSFCQDEVYPEYQNVDPHMQVDSCQKRAESFYGSTKQFPQKFNNAQGLMGNNRRANPLFGRAAKIFIMYCDGSLWFKQMNKDIFRSILTDIPEQQPKNLILAGSDVGGMYLVSQHSELFKVAEEFYPDAKQHLIIDTGLPYLKHFMQKEEKDLLYEALNEVAIRSANNIDDILNIQHLTNADEQVKMFIIEPEYDYWYLTLSFNVTCHHDLHFDGCNKIEKEYLEKIRKQVLKRNMNALKGRKGLGLWMIGCLWHEAITWDESYSTNEHRIPFNDGPNLVEALQEWYEDSTGQTFIHYDKDPWPANEGCSHLIEHLKKGSKEEPSMEDQIKKMQYEQQEQARQRKREEDEDL